MGYRFIIFSKIRAEVQATLNASKVKLDLYHVKINSYKTFQVDITKDGIHKSGKLNFEKGNNSIKSR